MKRAWLGLLASAIAAALASINAAASAEEIESPGEAQYESPESFAARGAGDEFIEHAKEFLEKHPRSASSPRAAFDLVIVATLRGDNELRDFAAARLVFDHPGSMQTAYLLKTFGQNPTQLSQSLGQYKTFLQQRFEKSAPTLDQETALKFTRAVELGIRHGGANFLHGDEFLLQAALAASVAKAQNIQWLCKEKLRSAASPSREIADISLGSQPPVDKFLALAEIADSKPARQHQSYYLRQLDEAERNLPEVRRASAATLLAEKNFTEALPIVDSLLAEAPSDQLHYWRAWCLAGKGKDLAALEALTRLTSQHADGPYAAAAGELTASLASLVENVDAEATALDAVLAGMRAKAIRQVEGRFVYQPKHGRPFDIYLAMDTSAGESMEVVVRRDEAHILAFRASSEGFRMWTQGDATIQEYGPGVYLAPQFQLQPGADGAQFFWHANLHNAPGGAESAFNGLLASPLLASKESILAMLRSGVTRGSFPAPATQRDGGRSFVHLKPSETSPELTRSGFSVDRDGKLAAFQFAKFDCRKLHYGAAGEVEFSPAPWPDLPRTEHKQFDGPAMMRFFASAMALFQDEMPK